MSKIGKAFRKAFTIGKRKRRRRARKARKGFHNAVKAIGEPIRKVVARITNQIPEAMGKTIGKKLGGGSIEGTRRRAKMSYRKAGVKKLRGGRVILHGGGL